MSNIPLTIAQHISQNAPFHPAAHHGRKEVKKKTDNQHTDKILKITNTSSSIVDQWMKDIKNKHKLESESEFHNEGQDKVLFRQPRLGLGAKFLPHSKAVSMIQNQSKLETAILKKTKVTSINVENEPSKEKTNEKEEILLEEFEDSRTDSILLSSKSKKNTISKPQGIKKSKKRRRKRSEWY